MDSKSEHQSSTNFSESDLKSIIQKAIRRGRSEIALPTSLELARRNAESLARRLHVIGVEELGVDYIVEITDYCKAIKTQSKAGHKENVLQLTAKAVTFMSGAPKNKDCCWVADLGRQRFREDIDAWEQRLADALNDQDPINAAGIAQRAFKMAGSHKSVLAEFEQHALARGPLAIRLIESIKWRMNASARTCDVGILLGACCLQLAGSKPQLVPLLDFKGECPWWGIDIHSNPLGKLGIGTAAKQLKQSGVDTDTRSLGKLMFFLEGIKLGPVDTSIYRNEVVQSVLPRWLGKPLDEAVREWRDYGPKVRDLLCWTIEKRAKGVVIDRDLPIRSWLEEEGLVQIESKPANEIHNGLINSESPSRPWWKPRKKSAN